MGCHVMFQRARALLGTLALATGLAACAAPQAPPASASASPPASPLAATMSSLQSLVGDARCSADAECRTIAVGAKACGGPEGYLAWSATQTDEAALSAAAERHAAARRESNAASGRMSTCSFLTDPGAACTAGRCMLRVR